MVYATACVLFHRFYHRKSLKEVDVWSVAMAAVVLAAKLEECPQRLRRVVLVFAHLYRRRKLCVGMDWKLCGDDGGGGSIVCSDLARSLSDVEKMNTLRFQKPMSPLGRQYKDWEYALTSTENEVLRELGFTVSWISDSHPHKFMFYIIRAIDAGNNVAQLAWNYCNESCRLDLCVHFESILIVSLLKMCSIISKCVDSLHNTNFIQILGLQCNPFGSERT